MSLLVLTRQINSIKINNYNKQLLSRQDLLQEEVALTILMHLYWPVEGHKILTTLFTMIKPVSLFRRIILTHEMYKIDLTMTHVIQGTCHNLIHQQITKLKTNIKTVKPWLSEIINSKPQLTGFWTFQGQYLTPLRPKTILKWARTPRGIVTPSNGSTLK